MPELRPEAEAQTEGPAARRAGTRASRGGEPPLQGPLAWGTDSVGLPRASPGPRAPSVVDEQTTAPAVQNSPVPGAAARAVPTGSHGQGLRQAV